MGIAIAGVCASLFTFFWIVLAAKKNWVRLLLPEKIYAVPGIECNLYFDNIVTVVNSEDFIFEVTCEVGRNDQKRWRWRLNLDRYHRKFFRTASKLGVGIIPMYVAIDGDHGFPEMEDKVNQCSEETASFQINAMHPNPAGYAQIGDSFYCYLLHYCHEKKGMPKKMR